MNEVSPATKHLVLIAVALFAFIFLLSPRLLRGQGQKQVSRGEARASAEHPGTGYAGSGKCAQCHTTESATQLGTPMAHALEAPADCEVLKTRPRLTFRNSAYYYEIVRQGNRSIYTVSDGVNSISEPILYCFGQGEVGQTYVFRHNGALSESRVSYFKAIQNLDVTIGQSRSVPASVEDALGRLIGEDEATSCFRCHAPIAVSDSKLQLDHLIPGVTCEGCHGPGEKHIEAVKAKKVKELQIFNPGNLDPLGLTQEFCGACHQSFEAVMLMPDQGGANNIRFQPYRIFNSKGHNSRDSRISCIACHNPHENVRHDVAFYDSKCLACHLSKSKEAATQARKAPACPVSDRQCSVCHMPHLELPGVHAKFTDHWIRVVRPGEPVPK
jgi:hypothetical protein